MKTSLILFFSIFLSSNINAQEIGISPVIIWTHNYELKNMFGVGASLSKEIWRIKLKVEYIYAKNERSYDGYMTYGFLMAPSPFSLEHINSTSSFTAYEFSINFPQAAYAEYYLTVGFGITFDIFTATRTGFTSGKTVIFDDETKSGPFFAASISRDHILWQPIKLELLFKIKSLTGGSYATDIEIPFASIKNVEELQLNLVYVFQ